MAIIFQDNFDADTVGALPSGWTSVIGTWAVGTDAPTSGANDLRSTSAAQFDTVLRTGTSDVSTDLQQYSFRFKGKSQTIGPVWRSDSTFNNAYFINFDLVGAILFFKRSGGNYGNSTQVNYTPPTFATGDIVTVERRTPTAGTHEFRVWNATTGSRPSSPSATFTDSTYTSGYSGAAIDDAASPGLDDYYYTDGSSPSSVTIAPNNVTLSYSPYAWLVGSTSAKTINSGSYLRTAFTGSSCSLTFDTSGDAGSYLPQIWCRIDGLYWQVARIASSVTLTMPSETAAWPKHTLEVVVKATSEFQNRWSPQATAVVLTGIVLASSGTVSAVAAAGSKNVLFLGDSITEGYHCINANASGADDVAGSDALTSWAFRQRDLLGVEAGVVGFGGQGLTLAGVGGVPALASTYNLLWSGQARTFSPAPDLIVVNIGTNDASNSVATATFQSAYVTLLNNLLSAAPNAKIAAMRPFNGSYAAQIQAAVAACSNPSAVTYVDTTGFFDTTLSVDGLHPLGVANVQSIAPSVAAKLKPLLVPTTIIPFRGTFAA